MKKEADTSVELEQLLDAPVEKVWAALTEKERMKEWYFDLSDFRAEPGFRFSFPGQGRKGEQYLHQCTVLEVEPQRKLEYSWTYQDQPGYTVLRFTLEPKGGQTLLKLSHRGLETFPDHPDFAVSSFREGWTMLITQLLPQYLEKN